MNKLILQLFSILVLITSCKKNEDNPISPKKTNTEIINYVGKFDFSEIDCSNPGKILSNGKNLFVAGCDLNKIYRYNSDLKPIDWIGFNSNGEFGMHDIADFNTSINGYLEILAVNETHVFLNSQDAAWENDSLIVFEIATGMTQTITVDFDYISQSFLARKDGSLIYYDNNGNIKRYNADGTFDKDYPINELSFWHNYLRLDADDNIFLLLGTQDISYASPYVHKYNSSISKTLEFTTHLRNQYLPNFCISDKNELFVEDVYLEKSEVYRYDRNGQLLNSYTGKDNNRIWMHIVIKNNLISQGNNDWEVWSIPE